MEVPIYAEVPALGRELGIAQLGTFHERQGEQALLTESGALPAAWGRVWGEHATIDNNGAASQAFSGNMGGVQVGQDLYADTMAGGPSDHYGLFIGYARAQGDVSGFALGFPNLAVGTLSINDYNAGGYWTHVGNGGWYTDTVLMGSSLTINPMSHDGVGATTHGDLFDASFEAGLPVPLSSSLSIEPQAQLIWQHVSVNDLDDGISKVSFEGSSGFVGRLGVRLQGQFTAADTLWLPYARANLWRYFSGTDSVTFAQTTAIPTRIAATAFQLGFGVVGQLSARGSAFATVGYTTDVNSAHRSIVQGTIGMRWRW